MNLLDIRQFGEIPWNTATLARIESHAWLDLIRSADRVASAAAGLIATRIGDAIAVRCRAGGPLVNRAYGAPADPIALRALRGHYEQAGVRLYFIKLDHPDHDDGERSAAAVGLVRYRRRMIHLVREADRVPRVSTVFQVGRAKAHEVLAAATLFCASFDIDHVMAPVIASLYGSPRWQFVTARARDEIAAAGILYLDDDIGYLLGSATAPRFRGMGAQRALIAARLELAQGRGCRAVTAHTGEPVLGDLQHSYRNMVRNGFTPIGCSTSYAPPGPVVWSHGRTCAGAT